MKKIKRFVLIISLLLILFNFSCNNNPVTPPEEDQPGRRDYEWTVDTINSFNPLYRLWGSSPKDVWAITTGNGYENIYHFDGNNWTTGKYLVLGPSSIYGFSANNIFIGAENGKIFHFNGNNFNEVASLTKDGNSDIIFNNLWGESANDLFAFGACPDNQLLFNESFIAHFYNNKWTVFSTDNLQGIVAQLYRNRADNKIYLQVIKYSNTYDSTYIYKYDNGQFIKLFNTVWSLHWATISLISKDVYFVLNNELAKRNNDRFITILNLENSNFYQRIWGRNSKDIFLEMTDGLAHYNGENIEYLFYYNQTNVSIFDSVIFENEVFFLLYEFQSGISLIYHGKLK